MRAWPLRTAPLPVPAAAAASSNDNGELLSNDESVVSSTAQPGPANAPPLPPPPLPAAPAADIPHSLLVPPPAGRHAAASPASAMFKGLSTLRAAEKKADAPVSEKAKALQAYLAAQYGGPGPEGGEGEKKKKKKKKRPEAGGPGLKILDQDVSGFAAAEAQRAAGPLAALSDDEDEGGLPRGTALPAAGTGSMYLCASRSIICLPGQVLSCWLSLDCKHVAFEASAPPSHVPPPLRLLLSTLQTSRWW